MRNSLAIFLIAASWTALAADTARRSPPFTIQRSGASPLSLKQYRGKVVALAFIYTSCSHCQQLTTELNLIARDYPSRDVQFLECAFNPDAIGAMPEFLERFAPPFPVGYSTSAAAMAYLKHPVMDPRPLFVPHMVFLDRAGVIRAEYPGGDAFFANANANIRAQLDKMLKARAPQRPATSPPP